MHTDLLHGNLLLGEPLPRELEPHELQHADATENGAYLLQKGIREGLYAELEWTEVRGLV